MPKIVATKEDWIKLGHELFSESGETGLNVDKMSRLLKCNKSSFYWHFKSKTEFIDAMIEHWINSDTKDIISAVNAEVSPEDKFLKLTEISFRKDSNIDFIFFLKKYGQTNDRIEKMVDRIDKERVNFVSTLLQGMGYAKNEAIIKARLYYYCLIGYHEMIRYKKQPKNFLTQVLKEINHFIKIGK